MIATATGMECSVAMGLEEVRGELEFSEGRRGVAEGKEGNKLKLLLKWSSQREKRSR